MAKENEEQQPLTRVVAENGTVWYPKYHKNNEGEWELNDKSFQKMFECHSVLDKPASETGKNNSEEYNAYLSKEAKD